MINLVLQFYKYLCSISLFFRNSLFFIISYMVIYIYVGNYNKYAVYYHGVNVPMKRLLIPIMIVLALIYLMHALLPKKYLGLTLIYNTLLILSICFSYNYVHNKKAWFINNEFFMVLKNTMEEKLYWLTQCKANLNLTESVWSRIIKDLDLASINSQSQLETDLRFNLNQLIVLEKESLPLSFWSNYYSLLIWGGILVVGVGILVYNKTAIKDFIYHEYTAIKQRILAPELAQLEQLQKDLATDIKNDVDAQLSELLSKLPFKDYLVQALTLEKKFIDLLTENMQNETWNKNYIITKIAEHAKEVEELIKTLLDN